VSGVRIAVHVTPRSSRDAIEGVRDGELLVRVTAAPDDGKANAAVCKLVASALGVPKSAVSVVRGHTSRHKSLAVEGADEAAVAALLRELEP
jgi:uncharacterized protein (TIGR00251 family)